MLKSLLEDVKDLDKRVSNLERGIIADKNKIEKENVDEFFDGRILNEVVDKNDIVDINKSFVETLNEYEK